MIIVLLSVHNVYIVSIIEPVWLERFHPLIDKIVLSTEEFALQVSTRGVAGSFPGS